VTKIVGAAASYDTLATVEAAKAFRNDILRLLKLATNWKTIDEIPKMRVLAKGEPTRRGPKESSV